MTEQGLIAAIILAAGSSSRMEGQQHKLLLPLGDRLVVTHVVEAALSSQARLVLVVLGHQAERVRAALHVYHTDARLLFVENPDYKLGMSTSLHAGLRALQRDESSIAATIDGVIVLLGDQPLITAHVIDMLINVRGETRKQIVAPLYNGRRGNPVLFGVQLLPELREVAGDEGGRSVVERHRQDMITVEVGDPSINSDVDTWSAYQKVVAEWKMQQDKRGTRGT